MTILVGKPRWSVIVQVALGAFIGDIVKGCFAIRVWKFSKHNPWITATIVLPTLTHFGFVLWYSITGIIFKSFPREFSAFGITNVVLGLDAFSNTLITLTLCYYIRQLKSACKQSDPVVDHLMLYAINTGILTSTFSVACLLCYYFVPENLVSIGLYFVLSKLYANSYLATLNARRIAYGRGTGVDTENMPTFLMMDHNMQIPGLQDAGDVQDGKSDVELHVDVEHEELTKSDPGPVPPPEDSCPFSYFGIAI